MNAAEVNAAEVHHTSSAGRQCLLHMPAMERYRTRPHDELDWAQWPVPPGDDDAGAGAAAKLCEPTRVRLRSLSSLHEAYILFVNATPYPVRTLWLNYEGNEIAYDLLRPGGAAVQQTFVTHPWIAREATTGTRLVINGAEAYCPHRPPPAPRYAGAAAAAAAPAPPPPAPAAGAGAAAAADQDPEQQQQQQQEGAAPAGEWVQLATPFGRRRVHRSSVQRCVITSLPPLPWSEAAHAHFPAAFRASARALLLCYQQLHDCVAAAHTQQAAAAVRACPQSPTCHGPHGGSGSSTHLGDLPSLLLPHIVSLAAPDQCQTLDLPLSHRPGIKPALLPQAPTPPGAAGGGGGAHALDDDDADDEEEGAWDDEDEDMSDGASGSGDQEDEWEELEEDASEAFVSEEGEGDGEGDDGGGGGDGGEEEEGGPGAGEGVPEGGAPEVHMADGGAP